MYDRKLTLVRWSIAIIMFTVCAFPAAISRAGSGEWTWMSGSDEVLPPGTYGTQGEPAGDNMPPCRYGSAYWTDSAGNFWFFGGYGMDSSGIAENRDYINDLWRYQEDNDIWTWMSGSDEVLQPGFYGTQGESAGDNVPGARYGSVGWADQSGDFWIFGGHGLDDNNTRQYLNDLWRYDPDSGLWTWMSGSELGRQAGIYGTQGEPAEDNVPGSRYESAAWADSAGNLWLFGGLGLDSDNNTNNEFLLNDLWRYNIDNGTWTWESGSDEDSERGTYGEKGEPAEDNVPGARYGSFFWADESGDFWLFGGYGRDKNGSTFYLSDLWRYEPDTNMWTWMSGPDQVAKRGKYGARGMPSEDNRPGARYDGVAWADQSGDFWLFGGYGYADSGRHSYLNDLWRYEVDNDTWTWISGSDSTKRPGIYGTQGEPAAANAPGARDGSLVWVDSAGNLRLFGGYGYDSVKVRSYMNDLWSFQLPADANMRIDTCTIKDGKNDRLNDQITDQIKFTGWMDAGEAVINAAMGGEIVVSLWTDTVPDPDATTFSFPINEETFVNGTYKSPKGDSEFSYDSAKGTMTFSAQNADLTGLCCPITLTIQIGGYLVTDQLNEDIVNGPQKPCPLPLMMWVWDSLDAEKFKAKKGSKQDSDTFETSGTFTVDGIFDTGQPVDITLGPDTFSVPGSAFAEKKGVYSCKKVDSGNGIVTTTFDTIKCTYSIKVTNTTLNGSGDVDFSFDIFGNALPPAQVTMPEEF